MKNIFFLSSFILLSLVAAGQMTFEKIYPNAVTAGGRSVIQTGDGGYVIASALNEDCPGNVYLVRTDQNGDTLWTRTYSGCIDRFSDDAIQQANDGGFMICGFDQDSVYLLRINSSGDSLRGTRLTSGVANSMSRTSDGGYIICGESGGIRGILLIKTDSAGNLQWEKVFADPPGVIVNYNAWSVKQTPDSGYIITGNHDPGLAGTKLMLLKAGSSGDSLWLKTYDYISEGDGYCVGLTGDQGFFVCGHMFDMNTGKYGALAIRLDAVGDTLWTREIVGQEDQFFNSGMQTVDGGFVACGTVEGPDNARSVLLMKFSANGDTLWSKKFDWDKVSMAYCVRQTGDNGFILCGETRTTSQGFSVVYVVKTDSAGLITGVNQIDAPADLQVFPNPASTFVTFKPDANPFPGPVDIILTDLAGNTLAGGSFAKEIQPITIDIRHLAPGAYGYRFTHGKTVLAGKLIIAR
jgi:hypothetical protein